MYLDLLIDTTTSVPAIKKRATDAQISVKKRKRELDGKACQNTMINKGLDSCSYVFDIMN